MRSEQAHDEGGVGAGLPKGTSLEAKARRMRSSFERASFDRPLARETHHNFSLKFFSVCLFDAGPGRASY